MKGPLHSGLFTPKVPAKAHFICLFVGHKVTYPEIPSFLWHTSYLPTYLPRHPAHGWSSIIMHELWNWQTLKGSVRYLNEQCLIGGRLWTVHTLRLVLSWLLCLHELGTTDLT